MKPEPLKDKEIYTIKHPYAPTEDFKVISVNQVKSAVEWFKIEVDKEIKKIMDSYGGKYSKYYKQGLNKSKEIINKTFEDVI